MKPLSLERLCSVLEYDAATGQLIWKYRPRETFKTLNAYRTFTSRFVGKVAGCIHKINGYREICIDGQMYRAHRLIWFMEHGEWPKYIDHEEGIKSDNRIEHMRDVSFTDNLRNCKRRTDNTSGVTGVIWSKSAQKWVARIFRDGKHRQVCLTSDFETAVAARKKAEADHGYHPNHGRDSK